MSSAGVQERTLIKSVSHRFKAAVWVDWHDTTQPVPPELQRFAAVFAFLQEERHKADYANREQCSATDARSSLDLARAAFRDWAMIREHPMAVNYLLAMLLPRPRGG